MSAPVGLFRGRGVALALIAPALAVVGLFFVAPLIMSGVVAFRGKGGEFTLEHFRKSFDYYTTDLLFTLAIVLLSTLLIGLVAIAIAATSRSAGIRARWRCCAGSTAGRYSSLLSSPDS